MKELAPHWVAFLGVLAGAIVASFSSFLSSYLTFRRERWFRRRDEKLQKYEAIYESLSSYFAMHNSVITPACFDLGQGRLPTDAPKQIKYEDAARLDMLIGLYAPEVSERFQKLRDRYSQMMVCLMETSVEVANKRPGATGIAKMLSILHEGAKDVVELKSELSRLARAHDL